MQIDRAAACTPQRVGKRWRVIAPLVAGLAIVACQRTQPVLPEMVNTAAALRQIPAGATLPARLHGVVTHVEPDTGHLYVQDATGGAAVELPPPDLGITSGDVVIVDGWTWHGDDGTVVVGDAHFTRVSVGELPAPITRRLHQLTPRVCDGRRVESAGTVAAATLWDGRLRLELTDGDRRLEVRIMDFPLVQTEPLIGARIAVRGICIPSPDSGARIADYRFLAAQFDQLIMDPVSGRRPPMRPICRS